jgi:hypothetical protein
VRIALLAAATCVVLGVAASDAARAAGGETANPKLMVLRLSDLPTGFARVSGHYASNARAVKESSGSTTLAELQRWGRITGYETEYRRQALVGLVDVRSAASTYQDEQGAAASLHDSYRVAEASRKPKFQRLSLGGRIGDEGRLYSTTVKQSGFTVILYAITWRYKSVKAQVIAGGVIGTVAPESAVLLARRQQKRIEAALG